MNNNKSKQTKKTKQSKQSKQSKQTKQSKPKKKSGGGLSLPSFFSKKKGPINQSSETELELILKKKEVNVNNSINTTKSNVSREPNVKPAGMNTIKEISRCSIM